MPHAASPAAAGDLAPEPQSGDRGARHRVEGAGGLLRERLWSRLGIRGRVTLTFGLGAFLLSVLMGGLSYFTARHFLLSERQNASVHQAFVDASLVRSNLQSGYTQYDQLLLSLDSGSAASSVLYVRGTPYSSPLDATSSVPPEMRALVRSGTPATQNFDVGGAPQIAVGVPIPSVHAAYFELFDESDLAHTLGVLSAALAAAGFVTTVLGVALGRWASGRSLRPLTGVSRAAVAIAGGELGTRLPATAEDPDLAGLTLSFNRMVDQLQERIEREERFTSDVSHELRSPLTTLAASLEFLESHRDELTPPARQALGLLGGDLRRFQRMVGDLLEISRFDTGSAELSLDEVEAGELVRRTVAANARVVPEGAPGPEVVVDPDVEGTRLRVDKRRFERVMANLLENAALYGGGATRVEAFPGSRRPDGAMTIRVAVEDRGAGVSPGERSRVFERFYRGQASGRRGTGTGTGLGLALVSEHVQLHDGRVWVEDAAGRGARFVVELPTVSDGDDHGPDLAALPGPDWRDLA